MPRIELIVDEENIDKRLDAFLAEMTPLSRNQIQNLIKDNKVLLNDTVPNKKVKTELNDLIKLEYEEQTLTDIAPQDSLNLSS